MYHMGVEGIGGKKKGKEKNEKYRSRKEQRKENEKSVDGKRVEM